MAASDRTNDLNYEMESHRNPTRESARIDQAKLIYGNKVHSAEVLMMREIVPDLDLMVILELLTGNEFNLERSIDAALALMTSLAAEEGHAVLSDSRSLSRERSLPKITVPPSHFSQRITNKEDFLPPPEESNLSSSLTSPGSNWPHRRSSDAAGPQQSALRGVPMTLSKRFLFAPRFRLVVDKHSHASTDFTIFFRRKTEKLGITIQEQDSEIRIHTLHAKGPQEPLLAMESGIKVGDILTGINSEYFSSGAEVQDIIDILHLAGTFVALHFTRRHILDDVSAQSYLSPPHKFAHMLIDQTVISKERANSVSKSVRRLKERTMEWDSFSIAQRVDNWKLDSCLNILSAKNGNSTTAPLRSASEGNQSRLHGSADWVGRSCVIPPSHHVRPAISVRLIRAEERSDHVVYVIWVMDIRSGAEWFVRRRFREFYEFRDVLVSVRTGISRLDFPPKRLNVAEIGAMISERLVILQKFLRKICNLVCVNSLHPSTLRIQLLLQQFLDMTDRMDNMVLSERRVTCNVSRNMVQVFVLGVLQMSVMDKVLSGYIDAFFESTNIEESKRWSEYEGRKVLSGMKDFVDNLEVVLFEALVEDCCDIIRKFSGSGLGSLRSSKSPSEDQLSTVASCKASTCDDRVSPVCTSDEKISRTDEGYADLDISQLSGATHRGEGNHLRGTESVLTDDNCIIDENRGEGNGFDSQSNSSSPLDQEIDDMVSTRAVSPSHSQHIESQREKERVKEREQKAMMEQCGEDEMRIKVRSAVRRQIEIEVIVPCSARLRIILSRSFASSELALRRNILKITHQPQSFFGIPVKHISPSSWEAVVVLMRDIRSRTLPHDRLEQLLLTAKEIPIHFVREHPSSIEDNTSLGADDFLPIFIYVIAKAQVPDLLALSEELQALCDPDKRMSETGYYLATLEASLQHILEANITPDSQALFPDMVKRKSDCEEGSSDDEEECKTPLRR